MAPNLPSLSPGETPFEAAEGHPRVLILGGRGYLGQAFGGIYPWADTPNTDVADPVLVREAIQKYRPEVVINCAGRCGSPNIDWCEDHKLETIRSNLLGPLVLLQECARAGAYLVHLSSGCIYSGDNGGQGFSEDDPPNFAGSFYSRSKTWADQALREFPALLLRLRMPFDDSTSDRNLIMKLRRYQRVLTAPNSLTCLPDFLRAAQRLIENRAVGIFNVANPGLISPYEVMELYQGIVDPSHAFEPLEAEKMGEVARAGRSNCALDTTRLENEGIFLPLVRDAVEEALRSLARKLAPAGRDVTPAHVES
jgi:3,5-epimerase/4-reductase